MAKSEQFLEEKFRESGGKRPYVQRLFGRIAHIYDPMNHLMSFGLDGRWRAFAARCLALHEGQTGLDLGAGTADLSIAVIRNSPPGVRMIGMDITPEMLEVGRRKLARLGLQERVELRVGDAEQIDLPDNSVDGCCSAFTHAQVDAFLQPQPRQLAPPYLKHLRRNIHTDHPHPWRRVANDGDGEISRSCPQIKPGLPLVQRQAAGGKGPPAPIQPEAHQVVHGIIDTRNAPEETPHIRALAAALPKFFL